jgi:hypothetical protein
MAFSMGLPVHNSHGIQDFAVPLLSTTAHAALLNVRISDLALVFGISRVKINFDRTGFPVSKLILLRATVSMVAASSVTVGQGTCHRYVEKKAMNSLVFLGRGRGAAGSEDFAWPVRGHDPSFIFIQRTSPEVASLGISPS